MSDDRKQSRKQTDRAARLAAALRENLKRRKAQARGRAAKPDAEEKSNPDSDMNGA
jgi:hypothetical protein